MPHMPRCRRVRPRGQAQNIFCNVRGIDGCKIEFVVGCFGGEFDGDDDNNDDDDDNDNDNDKNKNKNKNNNNNNADMTGSRLRGTLEIKDLGVRLGVYGLRLGIRVYGLWFRVYGLGLGRAEAAPYKNAAVIATLEM